MKFYDREEEQELLENIREASLQESQSDCSIRSEAYWKKPNWRYSVPQEI